MDDLVLLCDVDHGLVHESDLVITRRDGRLVVGTPDGRRIRGTVDAAFAEGIDRLTTSGGVTDDAGIGAGESFTGVQPIDELAARRPLVPRPDRAAVPDGGTTGPAADPLTPLLAPDGALPLPEAMHVNGERMDTTYAVGVLMGNRDLRRRLAAEARGDVLVAA